MKTAVTAYFEAFARDNPQHIALEMMDCHEVVTSYTYQQLNERANQLAHYLIAQGCNSRDIVAVAIGKSVELYIAVLAVWKMGGVLTLISTTLQDSDFIYRIHDSGAKHFLLEEKCLYRYKAEFDDKLIHIYTAESDTYAKYPAVSPADRERQRADPLYLAYTSGTTGQAKGILLPSYLDTRACFQVNRSNLDANTKLFQLADPRVDVFLMNLAVAWCAGGTLCDTQLAIDSIVFNLPRLFRQFATSYVISPPTLLNAIFKDKNAHEQRQLLSEEFSALQEIVFATEELTSETVRTWQYCGEGAIQRSIRNGFGATEECIGALYTEHPLQNQQVTIGHVESDSFPDLRLFIKDDDHRIKKYGVGELVTTGNSLMIGYWHKGQIDNELTETAFFTAADPDNPSQQIRFRRTGDRVSISENGYGYFYGRIHQDRQLEISGTRIESLAVESKLMLHSSIDKVFVYKHHERLVACFVLKPQQPCPTAIELRYQLCQQKNYNDAFVPSNYYVVNQKQFSRLQEGDASIASIIDTLDPLSSSEEKCEQPENHYEQRIQCIWLNVLNKKIINMNDDFYAIGGCSLDFISILTQLNKEYDIQLEPSDFSSAPSITIRTMARKIHLQELYQASFITMLELKSEGVADLLVVYLPPLAGGATRKYQSLHTQLQEQLAGVSLQSMSLRVPLLNEALSTEEKKWFKDNTAPDLNEISVLVGRAINTLNSNRLPVVLVGWSFGGLLSYSAARTVKCLSHIIVIDSMAPNRILTMSIDDFATRTHNIVKQIARELGIQAQLPNLTYSETDLNSFIDNLFSRLITLSNTKGETKPWEMFSLLMYISKLHLLAALQLDHNSKTNVVSFVAGQIPDGHIAEAEQGCWQEVSIDFREFVVSDTTHSTIIDSPILVSRLSNVLHETGMAAKQKQFVSKLYQSYKRTLQLSSPLMMPLRHSEYEDSMRRSILPVPLKHSAFRIQSSQGEINANELVNRLSQQAGTVNVIVGLTGVGKSALAVRVEEIFWQNILSGQSELIPIWLNVREFYPGNMKKSINTAIRVNYTVLDSYDENTRFLFILDNCFNLNDEIIRQLQQYFTNQASVIIIFTRGNYFPISFSEQNPEFYYRVLPLTRQQLYTLCSKIFDPTKLSTLVQLTTRYPQLFDLMCLPLFPRLLSNDDIDDFVVETSLVNIVEAFCSSSYDCNRPSGHLTHEDLELYNEQLAFLLFVDETSDLKFDYAEKLGLNSLEVNNDPYDKLLGGSNDKKRMLREHSFVFSYHAANHYFSEIVKLYLAAKYLLKLAEQDFQEIPIHLQQTFKKLSQKTELLFKGELFPHFLEVLIKKRSRTSSSHNVFFKLMNVVKEAKGHSTVAANLAFSLLVAARLSLSDWGFEGVHIQDVKAYGADLIGTGLQGMHFVNCDMRNVLWSDAILQQTKFTDCDFGFIQVPGDCQATQNVFVYVNGLSFVLVGDNSLQSINLDGSVNATIDLGREKSPTAVSISPWQTQLAVALASGEISYYEMMTLSKIGNSSNENISGVIDLDFSSDGNSIFALSQNSRAYKLITFLNHVVFSVDLDQQYQKIRGLNDPDRFLLSTTDRIALYDRKTGKVAVCNLFAPIIDLRVSNQDGESKESEFIVASFEDGFVRSYSSPDLQLKKEQFIGSLLHVDMLPQAKTNRFYIAAYENIVFECDSNILSIIAIIGCYGGRIVNFSKTSNKLLIMDENGMLTQQDAPGTYPSGRLYRPTFSTHQAVVCNGDLTYYLEQDYTGLVWMSSTEYVYSHPVTSCPTILAFGPWNDNRQFLAATDRSIVFFNEDGISREIILDSAGETIKAAAFSRDATRLVYITGTQIFSFNVTDTRIEFQDIITTQITTYFHVGISPNNSYISFVDGKRLGVYSLTERTRQYTSFGKHSAFAFHPIADQLAASDDSAVVLWDLASGHCLQHYTAHDYLVTAISFHDNQNYMVSGDSHGYAILWRQDNTQPLCCFSSQTHPICYITYQPFVGESDNKILLFALNSASLWRHAPRAGGINIADENVYSYMFNGGPVARVRNVRCLTAECQPESHLLPFDKKKTMTTIRFAGTAAGAGFFSRRYKRDLQAGEGSSVELAIMTDEESDLQRRLLNEEEKESPPRRIQNIDVDEALQLLSLLFLRQQGSETTGNPIIRMSR